MFCPQCKSEYIDGVTECRECGVNLVPSLPSDQQGVDVELVTVFLASDEVHLHIARSLLDDAGIEYFVQHDSIQDLFGVGRFGGFNIIAGPVMIQVEKSDLEAAQEVLKDVDSETPADEESDG